MDQNVRTTDSPTFNTLTLTGSLNISGNVNVVGANTLSIVDNFIYLNSNNSIDNEDVGIVANYNSTGNSLGYAHTGIFRDASDGTWKVFDGYKPEPDANVNIDTTNTTFQIANFQANTLYLGNTSTNWLVSNTSGVYHTGTVNAASHTVGTSTIANSTGVYTGVVNGSSHTVGTAFTANATVVNAATYYVGSTLIGNSVGPYGKTEGSLNVNSALTSNNSTNLGGTAAASYQLNSTLNANIAAYLPVYTGVVNGSSHTVGTAFTANATVVNAVSYYAGATLIGNTTGPYGKTEGNLNVNSALTANNSTNLGGTAAASYQLNSTLNANIAAYLPIYTGVVNGSSYTVSTSFIANATGVYHTGTMNAASYTVGSNIIANSTFGVQVQSGALVANTARNAGITFWTDRGFGAELHYGDTGSLQSTAWATALYGRKTDTVAVRIGAYPASNTSQNTFSEYITVLNSGNVGIGTTTPDGRLAVTGGRTLLRPSNEAYALGLFYGASVNPVYLGSPAANSFQISRAGGDAVFNIDGNGNTGIGNTAPAHKLSVNGTTFLGGNLVISSTAGISANGGLGTAGHVLHSNGSAVYWAADDNSGGTVTSVGSGNGLTGGAITSSGTLSVLANNGITANSTGLFVTPGTGAVVNATGVHVNTTYIGTLSANNASFLGGTAAASYQLNSTLNANIAAYLPVYTGIVNAASHTVGTAFTANATVVNAVSYYAGTTLIGNTTGPYGKTEGNLNVNSAATLATSRNINGSAFNGSAAITTATWGTSRTITIGSTAKSVDGSAAVSWTLGEIGAAATNQTMFIGTTSLTINRTTGSQTLTGVSIDGTAAGVPWTGVTGRPTAVSAFTNDSGYITSSGTATNFSSTTQNSRFNSIGVGTAASGTAGEIRATNEITAYFSDKRLKTVISPIESPLEKLMQLSGVIYKNNDLAKSFGYDDDKEHVGVLAQDVEEVLPQIVKRAPFDTGYVDGKEVSKSGEDYKTVQYDKLVPLLIEAIKEQQKQIEFLSDKVNSLEGKQ
jgi:hypothetical protein